MVVCNKIIVNVLPNDMVYMNNFDYNSFELFTDEKETTSIVDYVILSLARENIPFKEIIIDRKRYRVREQEVVTKNKIDEIIRRRKEFLNNNRIGYVKSTVRRLVK